MGRYDKTYGDKYEETEGLDVVELARRIKGEIRDRMKNGDLPDLKVSVTSDRTSPSIDVRLKGWPEDERMFRFLDPEKDFHGRNWEYTDRAREVLDEIDDMVEAYNFDGSDVQTDYFNVRFYGTVEFDSRFERERRAEERKREPDEPEIVEARIGWDFLSGEADDWMEFDVADLVEDPADMDRAELRDAVRDALYERAWEMACEQVNAWAKDIRFVEEPERDEETENGQARWRLVCQYCGNTVDSGTTVGEDELRTCRGCSECTG